MNNLPKTRKEQEVWHACDDLLAIGKTVKEITGEAIAVRLRELKYKAGSTTQRYQYRDTWMAARGISREERVGLEPSEFSDPIARATAVFKEGLERELNKEYEAKYQALEDTLAEKQLLIEDLQRTKDILQETLQKKIQQFEDLENRYHTQSHDYRILHEETIGHRVKITALEKETLRQAEQLRSSHDHYTRQQQKSSADFNRMLDCYKQLAEEQVSQIKEASESQRHQWVFELDSIRVENTALKERLSNETYWKSFLEKKSKSLEEIKEKNTSIEKILFTNQNHFEEYMKNFKLSLNNQNDFLKNICIKHEDFGLHKENVTQNLQHMNQSLQILEKLFKAKKLEKI